MNNDSREIIILFNNLLNYRFSPNNYGQVFEIYRFYYLYSVIKKYINNDLNLNDLISKINIKSELKHKIINNLSFLNDTFIKTDNLYISTYFNNAIKYLLPLPYELLFYFPILTFRKGGNIYKHIDEFDSIANPIFFDKLKKKMLTKKKNLDAIYNEIELNLDINLLHIISKSIEGVVIIIILDEKKNMFIYAGNFIDQNNFSCIFERIIYLNKINITMYTKFGIGLEAVFPAWQEVNKKIKINLNNIYYAQIYKKMKKEDFFNSFPEIKINKDNFNYLFRNCDKQKKLDMNIQLYTYFYPNSNVLFRYLDQTFCQIYKIDRTIDNVLDINRSIMSVNPFIEQKTNNVFFNNSKIKLESIVGKNKLKLTKETIRDDVFKCVSIDKDIDSFIKENKHCDINYKSQYSAKRRFYEIIYKTRRYDPSSIYVNLIFKDKIPPSINLQNYIYDIYRPLEMYDIDVNHIDGFILRAFNINGFISTDFELIFNTGNELFITYPNRFIHKYAKSDKPCFKNEGNDHFVIKEDNNKKGAYIYLNINENNYKDVIINCLSLIDTKTNFIIVGFINVGLDKQIQSILKNIMRLIELDITEKPNISIMTEYNEKIIIKEPYNYIFMDEKYTANKGSIEYNRYIDIMKKNANELKK